jgi:hypothetical protein
MLPVRRMTCAFCCQVGRKTMPKHGIIMHQDQAGVYKFAKTQVAVLFSPAATTRHSSLSGLQRVQACSSCGLFNIASPQSGVKKTDVKPRSRQSICQPRLQPGTTSVLNNSDYGKRRDQEILKVSDGIGIDYEVEI